MCKHRGGFPEGQSPIVWTPLAMLNSEYNIKYLKKTVYIAVTCENTSKADAANIALKAGGKS